MCGTFSYHLFTTTVFLSFLFFLFLIFLCFIYYYHLRQKYNLLFFFYGFHIQLFRFWGDSHKGGFWISRSYFRRSGPLAYFLNLSNLRGGQTRRRDYENKILFFLSLSHGFKLASLLHHVIYLSSSAICQWTVLNCIDFFLKIRVSVEAQHYRNATF